MSESNKDNDQKGGQQHTEPTADSKQAEGGQQPSTDKPLNPGPSRVGQGFDSVRMEKASKDNC